MSIILSSPLDAGQYESGYIPMNYIIIEERILTIFQTIRCLKSIRIRSYSGPYSVRMGEKTDQNNSEYRNFSRSDSSKLN